MKPLLVGNSLELAITIRENLMEGGRIKPLAVVDQGLPMKYMVEKVGLKDTVKFMVLLITRFVSSFNVSKNMTYQQIQDYAFSLVEESPAGDFETPGMRFEDYVVFFEQAKLGKWGKPFDYIDAALIETWIEKYWAERLAAWREAKRVEQERKFEDQRPIRLGDGTFVGDKYVDQSRVTNAVAKMVNARMVDGRLMTPDQEKAYKTQLREAATLRDNQQEEARINGIQVVADMIVSGNPLINSKHNRQFYENNREAIEAELLKRKNASNGNNPNSNQ